MRCTAFHRPLRFLSGQKPINQPRGKGIPAANAIQDLQVLPLRGLKKRPAVIADRPPIILRRCLRLAQRGRHDLERILPHNRLDHGLEPLQLKIGQVLVRPRHGKSERGRKIFFVPQHDVHIRRNPTIHLLCPFLPAVRFPQRTPVIVSYDLNYTDSLRKANGGQKRAQEVNRRIAPYVDVMLGNEEDFSAALGFAVPGADEHLADFELQGFKTMIEAVVREYPFQVVATTLRKAKTATKNDWGAICYHDGAFFQATERENLEILDRVGGGDSFASGLIYGFLTGKEAKWAVECGAAHGALAMTTPGDTTMVTLAEVQRLMKGAGARIER